MSDDPHDPLLDRLKALPARKNEHDPAPRARAAFEGAFVPWHQRLFGRGTSVDGPSGVEVQPDGSLIARSVVPVVLACIVAVYLMWAFASVLALQG